MILHDNERPHVATAVTELLEMNEWQLIPQSPYTSPTESDLFSKSKKPLRGERFSSIQEMSNKITEVSTKNACLQEYKICPSNTLL